MSNIISPLIVISMSCFVSNCTRKVTYIDIIDKDKMSCFIHKLPSMIQNRNKLCIIQGCANRAYYDIPGNSACYCKYHKTDRMITHPTAICKHKECTNKAEYGQYYKLLKWCEFHKHDGDINLYEYYNVPLKICNECYSKCYILTRDGKCYMCRDNITMISILATIASKL